MYKCRLLPVMLFVFTYFIAPFSFSEEFLPSSASNPPPPPLTPERFIQTVGYLNDQTQRGLDSTLNQLLGVSSSAMTASPPATSEQVSQAAPTPAAEESHSSTTKGTTGSSSATGLDLYTN